MRSSIGCMFCSILFTTLPLTSAAVDPAQVAGVWRGHSVCTVKDSPCRNEVNVYRISAIAGKPDEFFVSGNKIVDGKEVVMGTGNWKYDENAHELVYQFPRGAFRLKLNAQKLDGELKLPDGTVYRLIHLEKEK